MEDGHEQAPEAREAARGRRASAIRRATGTVVVLLLGAFLLRSCFPYDLVRCNIRGIPPKTRFAAVVGETAEGRDLMPWAGTNFGYGPIAPDDHTCSYDPGSWLSAQLRWIESSAVGVLLESGDREWSIRWFAEDASEPEGRVPLIGGGSWRVDLEKSIRVERLTETQVRALGIRQALQERESPAARR